MYLFLEEKKLKCQFLLGKVQQAIEEAYTTYKTLCQFLLGKVQRSWIKQRTFRASICVNSS